MALTSQKKQLIVATTFSTRTLQYHCTAASLGIDKTKKLVKMMKPGNMIKLVIMRLRKVPGRNQSQ